MRMLQSYPLTVLWITLVIGATIALGVVVR